MICSLSVLREKLSQVCSFSLQEMHAVFEVYLKKFFLLLVLVVVLFVPSFGIRCPAV